MLRRENLFINFSLLLTVELSQSSSSLDVVDFVLETTHNNKKIGEFLPLLTHNEDSQSLEIKENFSRQRGRFDEVDSNDLNGSPQLGNKNDKTFRGGSVCEKNIVYHTFDVNKNKEIEKKVSWKWTMRNSNEESSMERKNSSVTFR